MKGIVISMLVVLVTIHLMVHQGEAVVDCSQVDMALVPCISYLTSGGDPSEGCCTGVKKIKAIAETTADKQEACECAKAAAANLPNVKEEEAAALPKKCGVENSIPISKSMNCQDLH